jgi:hypothetical protein
MIVVEMPSEILRLGHPAPVSVRDAQGQLLIRKGTLVATEEQRQRLISRTLYVDESEGEQLKRIISGQLDALLRQNVALGQMAKSQADASGLLSTPQAKKPLAPVQAWSHLQMNAGVLVRDPPPAEFPARLNLLQEELVALLDQGVDEALLILVNLLAGDPHQRHATQALLVTVVAELAARLAGGVTDAQRASLRCAALTRYIAMATVQDQLALQDTPPSTQQQAKVDRHLERGLQCLRDTGISDPLWLGILERLAQVPPAGPFAGLPPEWQLARLLERADRFASQLACAKTRPAPAASDAVKAAFRQSRQQGVDEAGALVVKATSVYPPGSYVRLTSGEVGVVLQRGLDATSPKVAVLLSRSGTPLGDPVVRDTRRRPHDVAGSVAPNEVKVRLNMGKLVQLVR